MTQTIFNHTIPITQLLERIHIGGRTRTLFLSRHWRKHNLYTMTVLHLLLQLLHLSFLLCQRINELRLASLLPNVLMHHSPLPSQLQIQTDVSIQIRVIQ